MLHARLSRCINLANSVGLQSRNAWFLWRTRAFAVRVAGQTTIIKPRSAASWLRRSRYQGLLLGDVGFGITCVNIGIDIAPLPSPSPPPPSSPLHLTRDALRDFDERKESSVNGETPFQDSPIPLRERSMSSATTRRKDGHLSLSLSLIGEVCFARYTSRV